MVTAIQYVTGVPVWQLLAAVVCLVLALGILTTPVQWYVAYVGLESVKRRQRRESRRVGSASLGTQPE